MVCQLTQYEVSRHLDKKRFAPERMSYRTFTLETGVMIPCKTLITFYF